MKLNSREWILLLEIHSSCAEMDNPLAVAAYTLRRLTRYETIVGVHGHGEPSYSSYLPNLLRTLVNIHGPRGCGETKWQGPKRQNVSSLTECH